MTEPTPAVVAAKGSRSHRSSLWRLTGDGWRLYFHQGTPFSDDPVTGT